MSVVYEMSKGSVAELQRIQYQHFPLFSSPYRKAKCQAKQITAYIAVKATTPMTDFSSLFVCHWLFIEKKKNVSRLEIYLLELELLIVHIIINSHNFATVQRLQTAVKLTSQQAECSVALHFVSFKKFHLQVSVNVGGLIKD